MKYKELKSFSYGDNDTYAKEYMERFNSEDARKIDFFIGKNQAFFLQNAEVMTLAFEIEKLNNAIEKLCHSLPNVALEQYSKKCLIDEIVLTNKIEGVHSSRKEIGDALDVLASQSEKARGTRSRFLGLVNKYLKLTEASDIHLNSCEDVRALYDEVFLEEILHEDSTNKPDGKLFRKSAVSVFSETGKEIHTGIFPESSIIEAVDKALGFLNDDSIEPLFRVCLFHYFIEYIHPFYDGNGRLGRLILSYGISQTLTSLVAFRISETIKENINAYYKAFKNCNDQRNLGDVTPFLIMQLDMILSAMTELKKSLAAKKATWDRYEESIIQYCGGNHELYGLYSFLIQAALFSEMGISMQELEKGLEASSYLIKKQMQQIPSELLEVKKKGHNKYYGLNLDELNHLMVHSAMDKVMDTD